MWTFEATDPVPSPTVPSRPLCLSSAFWDGTKKPSLGRHRSAFVGKKLRDHSESDHPVARCGLSRPQTPFQVQPSLSRPLCLSSAFWDGTKKPSLGRHRSDFVGKKLRDHKESDHPVARCGLSRPRTPFRVRPSLYRPLCLSSAFWDETKKPSLGVTVRLLWARNFEITQNRTTQ